MARRKDSIPYQVNANQKLTLHYADAKMTASVPAVKEKLFREITDQVQPGFIHKENNFNDFDYQPLLPYKLSMTGPGITVGDVNNDKLEDFFIGNASKSSGQLFIQSNDGTFSVQQGPGKRITTGLKIRVRCCLMPTTMGISICMW